MQLKKFIETTCNKPISECSNQELYLALLSYTKEQIKEKETPCNDKKKLYYISAEFLIGKLLSNNLINLGIYDEVALLLKVYLPFGLWLQNTRSPGCSDSFATVRLCSTIYLPCSAAVPGREIPICL